jgi:hypothetical protein
VVENNPVRFLNLYSRQRSMSVLDQPQPLGIFQRFCVFNRLRLVFDRAALHF